MSGIVYNKQETARRTFIEEATGCRRHALHMRCKLFGAACPSTSTEVSKKHLPTSCRMTGIFEIWCMQDFRRKALWCHIGSDAVAWSTNDDYGHTHPAW